MRSSADGVTRRSEPHAQAPAVAHAAMCTRLRTIACTSSCWGTAGMIVEESKMPDMKAVYRMAILMTVAVTVCVDASAQNITLANTELVLTSAVRLRIPRLRGQL